MSRSRRGQTIKLSVTAGGHTYRVNVENLRYNDDNECTISIFLPDEGPQPSRAPYRFGDYVEQQLRGRAQRRTLHPPTIPPEQKAPVHDDLPPLIPDDTTAEDINAGIEISGTESAPPRTLAEQDDTSTEHINVARLKELTGGNTTPPRTLAERDDTSTDQYSHVYHAEQTCTLPSAPGLDDPDDPDYHATERESRPSISVPVPAPTETKETRPSTDNDLMARMFNLMHAPPDNIEFGNKSRPATSESYVMGHRPSVHRSPRQIHRTSNYEMYGDIFTIFDRFIRTMMNNSDDEISNAAQIIDRAFGSRLLKCLIDIPDELFAKMMSMFDIPEAQTNRDWVKLKPILAGIRQRELNEVLNALDGPRCSCTQCQ